MQLIAPPIRRISVKRASVLRLLILLALLLAPFPLAGCDDGTDRIDRHRYSALGDPERGKLAAVHYGCPTCHRIPGIAGSGASVGPGLKMMAKRQYIGGMLTNKPDNMVAWLQDPPSIKPNTAMPDLGLPLKDARDIAAYLYTLR